MGKLPIIGLKGNNNRSQLSRIKFELLIQELGLSSFTAANAAANIHGSTNLLLARTSLASLSRPLKRMEFFETLCWTLKSVTRDMWSLCH